MTASEQAVARITRNQHSNPFCSPSKWPGLICRWHCNSGVLEAVEEGRAFALPSAGFDTFPPGLCFIIWHILELENGPWQVHVEGRERGLASPVIPLSLRMTSFSLCLVGKCKTLFLLNRQHVCLSASWCNNVLTTQRWIKSVRCPSGLWLTY